MSCSDSREQKSLPLQFILWG